MTVETYTVIKATRIGSEKKEIGDEVELVMSQARPLQHGGFITFDKEAGAAIRKLIKAESEDDEQAIVDSVSSVTETDSESNKTNEQIDQTRRSAIRQERGD